MSIKAEMKSRKARYEVEMKQKMAIIMSNVNGDVSAKRQRRNALLKKAFFTVIVIVIIYRQFGSKLIKMF